MTSGPAIVAAIVAATGAGRLLHHLGGVLRRRPTERSTDMTSKQPSFPLRVYHWRWEILAVTLLPYCVVTFALWAGPLWASALLALTLGWAVLRRRQVRARFRAVALQHRLRAVFPHLRLPGGRPTILWSRPRGGDVVVSLYGREAFDHLHRHRSVLAEACSVPEVYVDRHPRYASLVTLTISADAPKREPGRASLPSNVVPLRAHS
ncbi:hypothetical protein [Amycolatopsis solani]|uniref:hypothetical protein n=1 Tax=Amycolatopsis solani TaxID=3028615 RepID=UPI0025B13D70|nr:hypothetical protein [Amycolatopsis sp. MEP2-6]